MSEDTVHQLEQLINESKMYNGKKIVIKSYKEVGTTIVVKTNGRTLNFLPSEIDLFFKDLKEVPAEKERSLPATSNSKQGIVINGYQPTAENITLKNSLMNVLEEINKGKVTKDKIQKAKSICDVANTIVNIQKAEIALINAVKK